MLKYGQKFDFPQNPAFQISRAKTSQSLNISDFSTLCKSNGTQATKVQESSINFEKRKVEFAYWKRGIKKAINGYNDSEFNELFINFINELNFSLLTLDEKNLIFSYALKYNTISRRA